MQLRNPWGRPRGDVEWRGDWSDTDTVNWTTRIKRKVNFIARADGIFWMSFEDFCEHFHSLYICRLYIRDLELPTNRIEKGWRKYTCPGTWEKGSTSGGAPTRTHKRAGLNPQYLLLPTMPHTSIFITLEQPSLYMAKHVCIFVSSVGGRRFQRIRGRAHVCDSTPFSNSALVSCEIPDVTEALESTRPTEAGGTEAMANESNDDARNGRSGGGRSGGGRSGGRNGGRNGSGSPSLMDSVVVNESNYFIEGALTIMVCTYEEDVVSDYRLTVYANYPLQCSNENNCAEGEPGESLPRMGAETPLEIDPQRKKMITKKKKRRSR